MKSKSLVWMVAGVLILCMCIAPVTASCTLTADSGSVILGSGVNFHGTCDAGETVVYLSLTGPNMPASGANMQATDLPNSPVQNGIPASFLSAPVVGGNWNLVWNTQTRVLEPGGYTVYGQTTPASPPIGGSAVISLAMSRNPSNGDIFVSSVPTGADIWLHGQKMWFQTNAQMHDWYYTGPQQVMVSKPGYYGQTSNMSIPAGTTTTVSYTLVPIPAPGPFIDIAAAGWLEYYFGEDIKFSGNNTGSAITYLYMTGPNLPAGGAQLNGDPKNSPVVDGVGSSFTQVNVSAGKWLYYWPTTERPNLDVGTYNIFAVTTPTNNLGTATYHSTSIVLQEPFISASANRSTGPPGAVFRISGVKQGGASPNYYANIFVTNNSPPYILGSLPHNGVKPTDFSIESISGINSTFGRGFVNPDRTFEYIWDTSSISGGSLLPGSTYLFGVVMYPLNWSDADPYYTKLQIGIEGPVTADYIVNTSSGTAPLTVKFTDNSQGIPTRLNLSFGDGTWDNSTSWMYTHTYNSPGTYAPVMYASNSISSDSGTNATIIVTSSGIPAPVAAFHGTPPLSGPAPLAVTFTDDSTGSPTGWAWFFGDESYTQSWTLMNASSGWVSRSFQTSVAMPDGSIVLMGGYQNENTLDPLNDAWRSTDNGATWTLMTANAAWSRRSDFSSVSLPDGSIVLMGGGDIGGLLNDVWRSTDNGTTWIQMNASAGWSKRHFHSSVTMPDGSIVLTGGNDESATFTNDTWRSTDKGATWTLVNASSGWPIRTSHTSVAMPDGSIVLMGGIGWNGTDQYTMNDTWRSMDNGATWTLINPSSGWKDRYGHTSVAMPDGSIVLMGGVIFYSGTTNDVWRSTDGGATWTQLTASASWTARNGHNSFVMPDGSIVLVGGNDGVSTNETWRLNPVGSSLQNPTHAYNTTGNYSVALQAYNAGGYNSIRKPGYITVTGAPATGSIAIASNPPGASIWVDDISQPSLTPYTVTGLTPVYHHVRVERAGNYTQEQSVKVESGVTTSISFTLDPVALTPGSIAVNSTPTGAWIWLDGVNQSHTTPYTLTGLLGDHSVKVTLHNYFNASRQVTVPSGGTVSVNITMDAIPAAFTDPVVIDDIKTTLKEQLDDDTTGTAVSALPDRLAPNTAIRNWEPAPVVTTTDDTSVVFIDDMPDANWYHPCRYVTTDALGKTTVVNAMSPPKDLATSHAAGNVPDPVGKNYNSLGNGVQSTGGGLGELLPMAPACTSSDCNNNYALLIDGGYDKENNHIRYWNDISFMYQTLNKTYGYPASHIRVLMSDGLSPADDRHNWSSPDGTQVKYDSSPLFFDHGQNGNQVTGEASNAGVRDNLTFSYVPELETKDLFIFTTGHGALEGNDVKLWLWNGESITATDFVNQLPTNAKSITIVMQQCNSGGFVEKFIPAGWIGQKRMIATSTSWDKPSQDSGYAITWTKAMARITDNLYPATPADSPPGNGDQKISIWEASAYAKTYDPNKPVDDPQYRESESAGLTQFLNTCNQVASATLTLTTPSGVDSWYMGYRRNITWVQSGLDATTVNVSLWNRTPLVKQLDIPGCQNVPANKGICEWNIPRGLKSGTDYRINVTSANPVLTSQKSLKLTTYASPGYFNISSVPNGATIFIDGVKGLKTNQSRISLISPGTHSVGLVLAGYESVEGLQTVIAGKYKNLSYILKPQGTNGIGNVAITSSPVSAEVVLNGVGTGSYTPYYADLAPDTYSVTVNAYGYETPASQSLPVVQNQPVSLDFALTPTPVPPILDDIIVPADPVRNGTAVIVSSTLTDPNVDDTFEGSWGWDDGAITPAEFSLVDGVIVITGTHTYTTPGVYTVNLTVIDSGGSKATIDALTYIIVYDPGAGYVLGAGSIDSLPGAYSANALSEGKAFFGFESRYVRNRPTPNGITEFYYQPARMNFFSYNYDWLVVTGAKSLFQGTGKINGQGNYKFVVSTIDGALLPKGSPDRYDKFRIKITDVTNGTVVYDNQRDPAAPDDANPITRIAKGFLITRS